MPSLRVEDLVSYEGIIPAILALQRLQKSYQTELQYELHCHHTTVSRAVKFLVDHGMAEEIPSDGKIQNVDKYIILTSFGREIAACLLECERKISKMENRWKKKQ